MEATKAFGKGKVIPLVIFSRAKDLANILFGFLFPLKFDLLNFI